MRSFKFPYIIILVSFLSLGCRNKELIDRNIDACFTLQLERLENSYGIKAKTVYPKLENFLIEKKHLKSISKKSYLNLIQDIENHKVKSAVLDQFNKREGFSLSLLTSSIFFADMNCTRLALDTLTNRKYYWQYKYLQQIGKIQHEGNLNVPNQIHDLMECIPIDKFEKLQYRRLFLNVIVSRLENKREIDNP